MTKGLEPEQGEDDERMRQKITAVVDGDLADLLVILAEYDVEVLMLPEDLGRPLKTRFVEAPVRSILDSIAIRIDPDAGVYNRGPHVYVGKARDEDQGLRLYHLPASESGDFLEMYQLAATSSGTAVAVGDVILVRDTPDGLKRIDAVHELAASVRRSYQVEVVYAELTNRDADAIGVDLEGAGSGLLQLNVGDALQGQEPLPTGLSLAVGLQGIVEANGGTVESRTWQTARLNIIEGEDARLQVGDSVNIRRRVISSEGTVTEADTQTFTTGFLLDLSVRAVRGDRVRLEVQPEISNVVEFIDGVPTIATRTIQSSAYARINGLVVLGGLTTEQDRDGVDRLPFSRLGTGADRSRERTRLFIFLRVKEVY